MSTWMILRSSAPCSECGSGNGQSPRLLRFYQEPAWERCPGNVIRQSNGTGLYAAPAEAEEMLMPILCQKANDLSSQLEIDHRLIIRGFLSRFIVSLKLQFLYSNCYILLNFNAIII